MTSTADSRSTKHVDTFILRFRDLNVGPGETIKLHRERCAGPDSYTWWGWWAKQRETVPEHTFSDFRQKAKDANGVRIFLFDSQGGGFFRAKCTDIHFEIPPRATISPQQHLTPEYYAHTEQMAWFKLTEINEHPIESEEVFGHYRYVHVAEVYTEDKDAFFLFDGQAIASAEELRAQNRTIWFVQKANDATKPEMEKLASPDALLEQVNLGGLGETSAGIALSQALDNLSSQVERLEKSQPGLPKNFRDEAGEALQVARISSQQLKADILMPPKGQTDVRLAPVHLLERYNEYASDLPYIHLALGVFLGGLFGLLTSLAVAEEILITPALIVAFAVLGLVALLLGIQCYVVERRKGKLWGQINEGDRKSDATE